MDYLTSIDDNLNVNTRMIKDRIRGRQNGNNGLDEDKYRDINRDRDRDRDRIRIIDKVVGKDYLTMNLIKELTLKVNDNTIIKQSEQNLKPKEIKGRSFSTSLISDITNNYDSNLLLPLSVTNESQLEICREVPDPIHEIIKVSKLADSIINTVQFQSLRDKKQLGACFMYIPTAVHDRFSHSLGVYHLAKRAMSKLQEKQPELQITDRDIEIVGIAGLCHDLGHGPYSHMFETYLVKSGIKFNHEDMSIILLRYIIAVSKNKNCKTINISDDEINKIACMIKGNVPQDEGNKTYMYSIICNKETGIDVDKFDYLQRDCLFTGQKLSFDAKKLLRSMKVIDGKICYNEKQLENIYEMFRARFYMFQHVYMNGINKGIELMIMDIISKIGSVINISEHINDPERYCKLTDNYILSLVTYFSNDKLLLEADIILNNIKIGNIYTIILEERWTPKNEFKNLTSDNIIGEIIARCGNQITCKDLRIDIYEINFGKGKKNPLKSALFYNKNSDKSFKITKFNRILMPSKVYETTIRIFITDPNNIKKKKLILNAYNDYKKIIE